MYKRYFFLVRLTGLRPVKFIIPYKHAFYTVFSFPNKLIYYLNNK